MKSIEINRISLVEDYVNNSDEWIENGDTEIQFCISSIKETIILLTLQKDSPMDKRLDNNIYLLSGVLRYMETLLKEAKSIREEGGEA